MSWKFDRLSMAETLEIHTGDVNSDWNKVFPQSCLMYSGCFLAGFFPGASPLSGVCLRFAGLLMPNRRQSKLKYLARFKTSNNCWKRKGLKQTNVRDCRRHADPRNITNITMLCLLPVFRYCYWSWEWYVFNHKYPKNDRGGDRGRPILLKV